MSAERKNRRMLLGLGGLGVFMLGMSFAAVPLYDMFCRVTGYGGTTSRAELGRGYGAGPGNHHSFRCLA